VERERRDSNHEALRVNHHGTDLSLIVAQNARNDARMNDAIRVDPPGSPHSLLAGRALDRWAPWGGTTQRGPLWGAPSEVARRDQRVTKTRAAGRPQAALPASEGRWP
jgi:hypothetical protein